MKSNPQYGNPNYKMKSNPQYGNPNYKMKSNEQPYMHSKYGFNYPHKYGYPKCGISATQDHGPYPFYGLKTNPHQYTYPMNIHMKKSKKSYWYED